MTRRFVDRAARGAIAWICSRAGVRATCGADYGRKAISDTWPVIVDGAVDVPPKYRPDAHFRPLAEVRGQLRGSVVVALMIRPRTVPLTEKRYCAPSM